MRIHLIATGGAVMHNLAIALHLNGNHVTGSDDEIYEPAKSRLDKHGLLPETNGWFPEKLSKDIDLVILGMHAREDNPELKAALAKGLKIMSFPEYIHHHARYKKRIVIAGSHGKTTLTSMIMHVLNDLNLDFDYLVGAQLEGFDTMVRLSGAPVMVIEGDEYLSSPLDRKPKFMHYDPQILLITGIAWDHMNVFPTKEDYNRQFQMLLQSVSEEAKVIYYEEDELLAQLVRDNIPPKNYTGYKSLDYRILRGSIEVIFEEEAYEMKIFGRHNFENMNGARLAAELLGIPGYDFLRSMTGFKGASKRLEYLHKDENTIVIKDFAHAPSKVRATTRAVRESFPDKYLIAVLELHTFSSLNRDFHKEFENTLAAAHTGYVYYSKHTLKMKNLPFFSSEDLRASFESENVRVFTDIDELWEAVARLKGDQNVYLFMSSGTFDGTDLKEKALELSGL